jgi:hypothetical protein
VRTSIQQLLHHHGLTASIGIFTLGLLGVIGYETQWGTSLQRTSTQAAVEVAKRAEIAVLPAFTLPALEAGFKETVDRPLFLPTRRPVPLATTAGASVMKKGQFRLAGTILNQDLPFAFLVEISTGKGMRVAKGSDILSTGISVASVDASRVVLKQGEESEELTLRTASSPPPPVPIPGPPGAASPGVEQRVPPSGVVVGAIPNPPAARVQSNPVTAGPLPGMGVLPGFVQSPGASVAAPAGVADPAVVNQRRRRFPNQPQQ